MNNIANPAVRCLPMRFNPLLLQADLAQLSSGDWQAHFNSAIYEGDWSGAALRNVPNNPVSIYSNPGLSDDWIDTPLLQACSYFQQVLAAFHCPLLSVRLLRLAPGAFIKEHRDYSLGLDYGEVRIHIVVVSNAAVECVIDGEVYRWKEGESWYADFSRPHRFSNHGATERVHMVLDCKVNDWLLDLLAIPSARLVTS